MKVAILAHGLRAGGGVSVGQNLIDSILRQAPENTYFLTIPTGCGFSEVIRKVPPKHVSEFGAAGNLLKRLTYEYVELPQAVGAFDPDVVLGLGNTALQRSKAPQAVLIHNPHYVYPLSSVTRPFSPRDIALLVVQRVQFRRDLRRIELLLCQTETMARRVRATYGYRGRVALCPNAISRFVSEATPDSSVPKIMRCAANKRRLLYLTAYYPHKNLESLVDLFGSKSADLKGYAAIITVSPSQGPGAVKLLDSIRRYRLEDTIINVGPLEQADLPTYYAHSHALLMPTLRESFSGTYLEAMYFGLPILTSDADYAREVCGDAALYFDPLSAESMVCAIHNLEERYSELASRSRLRGRAAFRNWDDVGQEVLRRLHSLAVQAH